MAKKRKQSRPPSRNTKKPKWSGEMCDDSLVEIISRLPNKPRSQFRCVSKSWNTMINYVSTHIAAKKMLGFYIPAQVPEKSFYLSLSGTPGEEFESRLHSLPFFSTFQVVHSCNGLLLFGRTRARESPAIYYVWNPVTMECVELPPMPTRVWSQKSCFLAYDPGVSPHYKVVRFTLNKTRVNMNVEIYSSETGVWAYYKFVCGDRLSFLVGYSTGVFYKGAICMLRDLEYLYKFEVEEKRFVLIKLPEKENWYYHCIHDCLGESRGKLYYVVSYYQNCELKVYMLNDGKNWQLMHAINTKNVIPRDDYRPIAFHPNTEEIYLRIVPNKIMSFNPCSGKMKEVQVLDAKRAYYVNWNRPAIITPCFELINPPGGKMTDPFLEENRGTGEGRAPEPVIEKMREPEPVIGMMQEARKEAKRKKMKVSEPEKNATSLLSSPRRSLRTHTISKF